MILKNNHEIIGLLLNIILGDDNKIILVFSIGQTVELPEDAIDIRILYEMKGKRIGLMYLSGQFKLRKITRRIKDGKGKKK
jgi:hypothetical protein